MTDAFEHDLSDNPTLESVAKLIGDDLATRLSCDFGGIRIYIPINPGEHSPVTASIGQKAANNIAQIYGGMTMKVPLTIGKRSQIRELLAQRKLSIPQIARKMKCHERTVERVKKSSPKKVELPLFD